MNSFVRFILNILKGTIFSVMGGLIGFLVTVSLINGNFPPTWKDVMSVKKKIEVVANLKKDSVWKPQPDESKSNKSGKIESYQDPELADVQEIVQYHKHRAQLSKSLVEGEMTFGSRPPPTTAPLSPPNFPEEIALSERIRKLEDLVFHLQNQIKTMNNQIQTLKSL